ncbi:PHD finger protein 7-like [Excalfactoria chinensis]|uniref:PHD finger protein 7-like n=1 Tax=Excalfactoria chinensis TaxID=46218 RepID=UPI003B3B31CD
MGQKLCTWFRSTRTACAETQEAAGSEEPAGTAGTEQPRDNPGGTWPRKALTAVTLSSPACVLCGRVDEYSTILGRRREGDGFYFHTFCVVFASGLCLPGTDNRNACFRFEDLRRTVREAEQRLCFVCGSSGATIICADLDCERSFHLPCASEGQCVTQHFNRYRAFCWEHRPQQAVQAAPEPNTTCIICMEPVDDSRSYGTMVCPACQHAWFHRACIQEQALSAGIYCFQCPLCRDWSSLIPEMLTMGIRIPFRNPTWEDNNAYAALGDRHRRCDASDCLYPLGREQLGEGPWQLLLCSSCAAQGTHRLCSNLSQDTTSWECDSCAGEGTASSTSSGLAGLSTTSQQGLQPSESSVSPESSSSGTSSQAPSGPDHRSCVPESSGLSIQSRTDRRRIPARLRRDQNILNESRGRRGRTHSAALMAESSTDSTNLRCRQGQRARTRSRSPLRRRAPESASRPQRHRGSGQTATPGAQSCTRSSRTPAAPGSSRASPAAHRSPFRHPGRARTRSRSPLHRRAADTDSQPRRRRTSRSRRRGPAQGRSRSRVPRRAQHITGRP